MTRMGSPECVSTAWKILLKLTFSPLGMRFFAGCLDETVAQRRQQFSCQNVM
jgi:hypothetical protein